jgi:hypothetical protein
MANSDISLIRFHRVLRALVHHQPHVVPAQSRDIAFESRGRLSATFYFFSAILLARAHRRVMSSSRQVSVDEPFAITSRSVSNVDIR